MKFSKKCSAVRSHEVRLVAGYASIACLGLLLSSPFERLSSTPTGNTNRVCEEPQVPSTLIFDYQSQGTADCLVGLSN